ncbi:MAG: TadE/TadG family type IV pilus assembly protein [Pseudodesulfovibrio sp.]|uniref:Flp pilus assembly protein TadG n=1 Tax=Pseudodesulfovibrio indicus TaxID=1716143 RepID=A0A126QSL8_9BACT|nr:TadE/TadG family type IV pilus assembly protein [Pseudodesulfovibrio indicus]AMK12717.1 pilus assembly protein TadE [Pseudodesulfovibrio indicus]TDT86804.1 Flp pilus assembly protein TadG [Pseudodesulfovibrio indicus]
MRNNRKNSRRGLAAVETALVLPILFILAMGVIEGGNAVYAWVTVQKAAQRGAHYAATGRGAETGTRLADIINTTQAGLTTLDPAKVIISVRSWPDLSATGDGIDNDAGAPCQLAEVAVLYNYEPFTPLVASLLPDSIPLRGYDRKVNEPWKPCD